MLQIKNWTKTETSDLSSKSSVELETIIANHLGILGKTRIKSYIKKIEFWNNVIFCQYVLLFNGEMKTKQTFVSYKILKEQTEQQPKQPEQHTEQTEQQILPNININLDGKGRGRKPTLTEKKFERKLKKNFSSSKKFFNNNTAKIDKILEKTFTNLNEDLEGVPDENFDEIWQKMTILHLISEALKEADVILRKKVEELNTSSKLKEFLEFIQKEAKELNLSEINRLLYNKRIF